MAKKFKKREDLKVALENKLNPRRVGESNEEDSPTHFTPGHKRDKSNPFGSPTNYVARHNEKQRVEELYAFTGMHHLFDHHQKPVSTIRFANDNNDLIAFCSEDGTTSICTAYKNPRLIMRLMGHEAGVTDIKWSIDNQFLASCSADKTLRMWNPKSGECVRILNCGSETTCCAFHPLKNNLLVVSSFLFQVCGNLRVKFLPCTLERWDKKIGLVF